MTVFTINRITDMEMLSRGKRERGAIIIHVAFALLALLAFSAFVVDMGMMWVSRGQAQNAADAGALAGAVALMRDGGTSTDAAKSAFQWTNNNAIFGAANSDTNVRVTFSGPTGTCGTSCDVATFPPCAPDKPGCVRVDVFRNAPDRPYRGGATLGDPVPTLFGPLIGITEQRVRATATAQVSSGNQIKCMLPFAVIDRWADNYDPPVTTYFPDDALTGTAGWTPNDACQPTRRPLIGTSAVRRQHQPHRVEGDVGLRTTAHSQGRQRRELLDWLVANGLPEWSCELQCRRQRLVDDVQSAGGRHCDSGQRLHGR